MVQYMSFVFCYFFLSLFEKQTIKERLGETGSKFSSADSLLKQPKHLGLGQVEGKSQELYPGLPRGWQGHKHFSHLLLPCQMHQQTVGPGVEQLRFEQVLPYGILT